MRSLAIAMALAGACVATVAHGTDTLVSHGVTYRICGNRGYYEVLAQDDTSSARLTTTESFQRGDDLVAAILEMLSVDRSRITFVRDTTYPYRGAAGEGFCGQAMIHDGKCWVMYSQRHQGYQVWGRGGHMLLDDRGRILTGGVGYVDEVLPTFKPKSETVLLRSAQRAVPHRIIGPPIKTDFYIASERSRHV